MPLKRDSAARLDNVDLFVLRFWMLDSNKRVPCGVTELALKDLATMDGEPWTTAMQDFRSFRRSGCTASPVTSTTTASSPVARF